MREIYIKLVFMLTGLVHLLPFSGLFRAARIEELYGISFGGDADLSLLMQHRALFFGIVGLLSIIAIWRVWLRPVARLVALASMLGFVVLYLMAGSENALLAKVFWADVVLSILILGTFRSTREDA
ncbi:hypothetical protein [Kordiimonas aestuarii]|uniref:hypothetical protein n=1 Tax=Kordiimonas aestuarii TaxID=1005925 RepID=UPI0021CF2D29|nr:hypothetical protein [Kordiimonas aestuarii]